MNSPAGVLRGVVAGVGTLLAGCSIDSHFLYHPQPYRSGDEAAIAARYPAAEAFALQRPDGTRLHGWLMGHRAAHANQSIAAASTTAATAATTATTTGLAPLTIYFGGNAEETSWLLGEVAGMTAPAPTAARRVFLFMNYRGYGGSGGAPHEKFLLDDALAVYDAALKRPGIDAARVSVWGRSLGTGVAVHVARERRVSGLVLVSPYDSMTALAQHHMPALSALLTQHYDSLSRAPAIRVPALMLAGARDTLVPPQHSEKLRVAWGGPARLLKLPAADHNSISGEAAYWHEIATFLSSH